MVIKLGIEIEIACKKTDATDRVLYTLGNWSVKGDGSIKCKHSLNGRSNYNICNECAEKGIKQYEFLTNEKPYTVNLRDINATVEKIAGDVAQIFATLQHIDINRSQGIHFHFSGIKKYAVVFSKEFFNAVKEKYLAICTTETERERVTNYYCNFIYSPRDSDRYRAINIIDAFNRHGTFEFRFFASTDKSDVLKRYIRFVLDILKEVKETQYDPLKYALNADASKETKSINLLV